MLGGLCLPVRLTISWGYTVQHFSWTLLNFTKSIKGEELTMKYLLYFLCVKIVTMQNAWHHDNLLLHEIILRAIHKRHLQSGAGDCPVRTFCGQRERGSVFLHFVRTSFMDGLLINCRYRNILTVRQNWDLISSIEPVA